MVQIIIEGFTLGLATGVYCLGACSPFLIPYLLSEAKSWFGNILKITEFMAGRLIAYILFALLASIIGSTDIISKKLIIISTIIISILMIFYGITKTFPETGFCKAFSKSIFSVRIPFFLGFVIGINLCPPFILGLTRLIELGNIFKGIIFFSVFFCGTTLYMMIPVLFSPLYKKLQNIGSIVAIMSGLWFLITGIIKLL